MSWIDEQIKLRIRKDDEAFQDAVEGVNAAITRKRLPSLGDDRTKIKNAIDEILGFYHLKSREIPPEVEGFEAQLEYLCRPHGMMRRRVKLEPGWYRDATGAMLAKRRDGEAVALLPGKLGGYTFYDAKQGKRVRLNRATEKWLEEDAICFYRPLPQRKIAVPDLLNYLRQLCPVFTLAKIVLLMLATTLVGLLTPRITQMLFSDVLQSGSARVLMAVAVLSLSVSLSMMLVGSVKTLIMRKVSATIDISVQAATMARVLSLPTGFFKQYNAGEITSRAQYVNSLCSTLVSVILSTSLSSLFSLVYLSQVFVFAPMLVVPSVCITVATIVFSQIVTFAQVKLSKRRMEVSSKNYGMTYSLITGVQKIKLAGGEKRLFSRWLRQYTEEMKLTYSPPLFLTLSGVISMAINLAGTIILYYFAAVSGVSVANYYAFTAAYGMVSGAFFALAGMVTTFANIKPTIDMAKPIMEATPEISEGKRIVTKLTGEIELSNVSFRYALNMPLVIDDLSLKIDAGQYVAIVGRTGCGKSTLIRLLLGFETPQKGAVYYDGNDLSSLDPKSLRRYIGTVMQNAKLFRGDVFTNIVISAPHLTPDDAWAAAELACIADDIREMPMGMHTVITEGSGGVSGGQKQRLMIARAIAPKPKVLLFDEATSALDNTTQRKVSEALGGLKCTRIVVAHRLSTIRQCDRILVLDKGRIAEDGDYDTLIQKGGLFAELVARQRLDDGKSP